MNEKSRLRVHRFSLSNSAACTALCLLVGFAPSALSQEPQSPDGPTVLSVTTQLVTLDVTVNDKSGHPVLDLAKPDFNITENGVPQKVRYFESPSAHRMPSSGEVVRSAADLGKIGDAPVSILVLDEINTRFADMALARSALNRYLKAQPDVLSEPTALFFVDNQKLDVIQDYTQDKAAIMLALKKHFPDYPWQLTVNSGDRAMLPRMSSSLTALLQIAEATRGIRGRKNVTWVGEGFPSVDITQSQPDSVRVITDAIKKTTFALLQSKVSLFTIDPVTLETTQVIDEESDSGAAGADLNGTGLVFGGAIQFSSMAASTGGHAFAMNNFIDQEIASSISDGANYYELSYSPTNFSEDPTKYRKIVVKVTRPGLTVIARDGYFPADQPSIEAKVEEPASVVSDVRFDLETAGLSKVPYNGLAVTAAKQSDGVYEVSIDASGLQWREDTKGHIAELSMMAVCFSAKDKPLSKVSSEHTADTNADVTQLTGALKYKLPLSAPRGTTRIRFVVRDLTSGKIGTTDVNLP
jgi:VWFA-related protein